MAADNELKVLITAQNDQLKTGMAETQAAVKGAIDGMTSQFGYLHSTIQHISVGIRENFAIIGETILAALTIKGIKEFVGATEEYAGGVRKLSNMMGITAEAASELNVALQIAGLSVDEYVSANLRLQRQLKANEGKFTALGVEVRDSTGAFLPQPKIFENVIEKMKEYKSGADQLQFAMDMLGARGADAAFKFLRLKEAQEMAEPIMRSLNLEMGQNGVDAAKRYEMQTNALGVAWTALKVNIGMELIPTITDLAKEMLSVAQEIIPTLMLAGKGLVSLFLEIRAIAAMMAGAIITAFAAVGDVIGGAVAAAVRLAQRDFKGAWIAISEGVKDAKKEFIDYGNTVVEIANDTAKRIEKIWSGSPMIGGTKPSGTKLYTPAGTGEEKESKSRAPDWKNELEQMKMDESAFFNFSLDREKAFWEGKLAISKKGSEEYRTVQHELFEIAKKQAKDATDAEIAEIKTQQASDKTSWMQKLALEDQKLAALGKLYGKDNSAYRAAVKDKQKLEEEAAKASIALNQKIIESQLKGAESVMAITEIENRTRAELGAISTKKEIELNRQALDEIYNMKLAALSREAALYKDQPIKYQEMLEKIKELEWKHNEDMAKSQQKLALDQKKRWDSFLSPIKSALDQSVQGIIQGTTTLKQAFQNLATSILTSMGNMLIQLGLEWAQQQAMQLLGIGTTQAAETAAAATTVATTTATSAVVIPAKAAEAGAGAAASQAFIPFIGPALALAAMAAVFGAVMALKSAAGGYDIPAGTNPITQLHSEEMVLPASIANNIRDMTNQGGGRATITVTSDITVPILTSIQTILAKSQTILQETLGITKDERKLEVTKEIQSGNIMGVALGKMFPIPFAAGGWDVDKGGLTMIHDKEMVLPSHLAEGVRNMTARGGANAGTVNNHFHITAMDSKDVMRVLTKNYPAVAKAGQIANRNFVFNKGR